MKLMGMRVRNQLTATPIGIYIDSLTWFTFPSYGGFTTAKPLAFTLYIESKRFSSQTFKYPVRVYILGKNKR